MGRQPCCEKSNGLRRGPWTLDEDHKLITFILNNGIQCWRIVPKLAGLMRCGKSCRLRWINYLRPDLKRGAFTEAEEDVIIQLHARLGNRWSKIATHLPGRTDNEIKNHWNTRIKKKLKLLGLDPQTHKSIAETIKPDTITDQHENSTHSSSSLSIPMKPEFTFHSGLNEERKLSADIPTSNVHTIPGITEMGLVMNHEMESFSTFSMGLGLELIPQNFWIDESPSQWDVFNDSAGLGGL